MRYVLIVLLLAGCGTTPKEVMESGTRTVHTFETPPERTALCMARNVENHDAGFIASIRAIDGVQELIVRLQAAPHAVFVALVEAFGKGSRATVYERGYLLGGTDAKAAMLAGCPTTRKQATQDCNTESAKAAQTSVASAYQGDAERIARECMERRGFR